MPERDPLVSWAEQQRLQYGMNDDRFAREVLGITPGYWSSLKSGRRRGGRKLLRNLLRRFPHLALSLPADFPTGSAETKVPVGPAGGSERR